MARIKVVVPIAIALVFAFAGALIAFNWAQSLKADPGARKASVQGDVVEVAVAASQVPWGTKLSVDDIEMRGFLKKSLPEGFFTEKAELANRVLVIPLEAGDIILESRLAPTEVTSGGIAAVITPGNRAVAVKGDKVVGLAGLIKPHDRVDVLVTLDNDNGRQGGDPVTKVVLENILVLAAGTQIQKGGKGKKGEAAEAPVDVYTLEVTPEEGERLALASHEGRLHFALRSALDSEIVLTKGATVRTTLASYRYRTAKGAVKSSVGSSSFPVETIHGTSRTRVNF
jgi:pilus assembly protein CpaB